MFVLNEKPSAAARDVAPTKDRDVSADRRVYVRAVCNLAASACVLGKVDTKTYYAAITDNSHGGLGLWARRRYEVGTLLLVWAETRSDQRPLLARVAHCRTDADGSFHGLQKVWQEDPTD